MVSLERGVRYGERSLDFWCFDPVAVNLWLIIRKTGTYSSVMCAVAS
jgi:hypothetical protein